MTVLSALPSVNTASALDTDLLLVQQGGTSRKASLTETAEILAPRIRIEDAIYYISGGGNSVSALRAAIAAFHTTPGLVRLGPGTHVIDDPIFLSGAADNSANNDLQTLRIEGAGMGYSDTTFGTTIDHSLILDRPCFCIQKGRSISVGFFQMAGPNNPAILTSYQEPSSISADYVAAGIRNSRYSPQCAIAIDPKGTAVPADGGYPGFTYGMPNEGGSYFINIHDLVIRANVVGIMISPSGLSANASSISITNTILSQGFAGVAVGQSQARNLRLINTNIDRCFTGFDGMTFGDQQGVPPSVLNGEWGYLFYLFQTPMSFGTPLSVNGLSWESVKSIGLLGLGTASNQTPATFSGCRGQFENSAWAAGPHFVKTYAPISIRGCKFSRPINWTSGDPQTDNLYIFLGGSQSAGVDGAAGGRNLFGFDSISHFGQGNAGGINGFSTLSFRNHSGVEYASQVWDNIGCNHTVI